MTTTIGNKIRELRKQRGWTLEKLAEETESSKSYIWELENKNPPRPSAEKIAKIASALKVTTDYLVDESGVATEEDAKDVRFYREYRELRTDTRERIREMVEIMKKAEKK